MSRKRLDLLLVELNLFESRGRAQAAIAAGCVRVDGEVAQKASDKIDPAARIEAEPAHPWVSRAALKLEGALALWPIPVEGRTVLDVGASTGGFTEICLSRGAAKVYAVDVGRDQLHASLRTNPRVVNLQATDARTLDGSVVPDPVDLVVCDASFIGLAKVLPAALRLAEAGADLVALIKPQFEVGPSGVGKGGLVKNGALQQQAVEAVRGFVESAGWQVQSTAPSSILGGNGNREYLLWGRKAG